MPLRQMRTRMGQENHGKAGELPEMQAAELGYCSGRGADGKAAQEKGGKEGGEMKWTLGLLALGKVRYGD